MARLFGIYFSGVTIHYLLRAKRAECCGLLQFCMLEDPKIGTLNLYKFLKRVYSVQFSY